MKYMHVFVTNGVHRIHPYVFRLQFRYGNCWGSFRPSKSNAGDMQEILLAEGETFTSFSGFSGHIILMLQFNTSSRVYPKFGRYDKKPNFFASLDGLLYFCGASYGWGIVSQVQAYRSSCWIRLKSACWWHMSLAKEIPGTFTRHQRQRKPLVYVYGTKHHTNNQSQNLTNGCRLSLLEISIAYKVGPWQ